MGQVIMWNGITKHDLPSERILQKALDADLAGVVLVGYTQDGQEYFASTYADGRTALWLMERLKMQLLNVAAPRGTLGP